MSETRLVNILGDPEPSRPLQTRHFLGLPPGVAGSDGVQTLLPFAKFLVIEQEPDGTSLYRYSKEGEPAGDTWHTDFDEALHQAEFEFGELLGRWESVPADATDAVSYAQSLLARES